LISEIVRGAGAVLRDRHGVRFMPKFHPQADLAPRDVVSRAVFERMVATNDTSVYLDLSNVEGDPHLIFPGISRICRFFGIDIARDSVPVRPGAHYMIGGVEVDLDGRSSRPGLWAVGECASTGLHGANRMGSNSLLEGIVLGARVGECAARELGGFDTAALDHLPCETTARIPADVRLNLQDLTYSLKSMMWRQMGVARDGAGMEDALAKLRFWSGVVRDHAPRGSRSWELINMLTVAHLATLGALARTESRGVHFRSDYPEPDSDWVAHTTLRPVTERDVVRAVAIQRDPFRDTISTE
jgi:L-aspartate oxidase